MSIESPLVEWSRAAAQSTHPAERRAVSGVTLVTQPGASRNGFTARVLLVPRRLILHRRLLGRRLLGPRVPTPSASRVSSMPSAMPSAMTGGVAAVAEKHEQHPASEQDPHPVRAQELHMIFLLVGSPGTP